MFQMLDRIKDSRAKGWLTYFQDVHILSFLLSEERNLACLFIFVTAELGGYGIWCQEMTYQV